MVTELKEMCMTNDYYYNMLKQLELVEYRYVKLEKAGNNYMIINSAVLFLLLTVFVGRLIGIYKIKK
jgi:hypothetical protein